MNDELIAEEMVNVAIGDEEVDLVSIGEQI